MEIWSVGSEISLPKVMLDQDISKPTLRISM